MNTAALELLKRSDFPADSYWQAHLKRLANTKWHRVFIFRPKTDVEGQKLRGFQFVETRCTEHRAVKYGHLLEVSFEYRKIPHPA